MPVQQNKLNNKACHRLSIPAFNNSILMHIAIFILLCHLKPAAQPAIVLYGAPGPDSVWAITGNSSLTWIIFINM